MTSGMFLLRLFGSRRARTTFNVVSAIVAVGVGVLTARHFVNHGWPLGHADVLGVASAGLLFLVASHGDRLSPLKRSRASALIYPLSLAIYCTSWTFFGSVGFATRTSIDFLAIYVGPILMIGLCTPLLRRVIQLASQDVAGFLFDLLNGWRLEFGLGPVRFAPAALPLRDET